jgi:hypothetical protein
MIGLTVFGIVVVSVGAAAAYVAVCVHTLSVTQRAIFRFWISAAVVVVLGLLISGVTGQAGTFALFLLFLPPLLIGYFFYWLFEKIKARWIIALTDSQRRARSDGNLKRVWRLQRMISIVKRTITGSVREIEDTGV